MTDIGFLFDLDGVLIDSEREYTRIWNEIEKKFPTGKPDFALIIKGQTLTKILTENYPDNEIKAQVKEELHRLEREMQYEYCAGAAEFLAAIRNLGYPIAVVTSSDEVKMAHLYADIPGFKEKVDYIIDSSKVTKSKPHPEGYLKGAKAINTDIRHCAVFEDSVQGVMAGNAAGAMVIGITGTKTAEELQPYAHQVVSGFDEIDLEDLIERLKIR